MDGVTERFTTERFTTGDVDAFETLFRQYQGEFTDTEELTIETFWRIYRQRQRFDAERPFGPWARRIATRGDRLLAIERPTARTGRANARDRGHRPCAAE
jgi:hypothetical protein